MPIYEYQCNKCSKRFEIKQRFEDDPVAFCPECKSQSRRIIHCVPIVFKGSGFYCTDHGKGSGGDRSKKDDTARPTSEASKPVERKKEDTPSTAKTETGATD